MFPDGESDMQPFGSWDDTPTNYGTPARALQSFCQKYSPLTSDAQNSQKLKSVSLEDKIKRFGCDWGTGLSRIVKVKCFSACYGNKSILAYSCNVSVMYSQVCLKTCLDTINLICHTKL